MEALLERLTQVEVFEHVSQRTFPGRTRFSIEGADNAHSHVGRNYRRSRPG